MSASFVGRQPIVDRDQRIVAYELLFRASRHAQVADVPELGRAAVRVIVNTFASLGMDAVLGDALGFFNVNREVLLSEAIEALPRERVVIEVLEDVPPDDEVVDRCRALRAAGFQIAADDWVLGDPRERLLPHVDLVKVDLPGVPPHKLRRLVRELQSDGRRLLAEKVETIEQYELCRRLGFDLFQGFFFARPIVLEGADLDASKTLLIQLMQQIAAQEPTEVIVGSFKQDAKLGLNLLRLVNTAGNAARVRLETIEDAVRHLGLQHLGRWVSILLYANAGAAGMRSPLLVAAAHRARLMELVIGLGSDEHIANGTSSPIQERAFLVGMLSLADALLQRPIAELVQELHLGEDIGRALTGREGRLGGLLCLAEAVERSDVEKFEPQLDQWDLDVELLQRLEHEAYGWVHDLVQSGLDGDPA